MFQSRFAALIADTTEVEKSLESIDALYPTLPVISTIQPCKKLRKGKHLCNYPQPHEMKFTNARPIGVKVITPVRIMIARQDTSDLKAGTWVIDNDTAFTYEWNNVEGKMTRKVICSQSKDM